MQPVIAVSLQPVQTEFLVISLMEERAIQSVIPDLINLGGKLPIVPIVPPELPT
jgi:hypothetical protein